MTVPPLKDMMVHGFRGENGRINVEASSMFEPFSFLIVAALLNSQLPYRPRRQGTKSYEINSIAMPVCIHSTSRLRRGWGIGFVPRPHMANPWC
jgi:hypothetical protein